MKNIITNIFESDEDLEGAGFIPVVSDGTNNFELKSEDGDDIPILPLRNVVMFPDVVLPVSMGRRKSLNAVRHAYNTKGLLAAFTQKDSKVENPKASDLYGVGVVVSVVKILEWDGNTTAILQGRQRVELVSIDAENPFYKGRVSPLYDVMPGKNESKEFNALLEAIKDTASRIIKGSGNMPPEAMFAIRNLENPSAFINFTSANLGLQDDEKQKLLSISDLKDRGYLLLSMLNQKLQLVEIKQAIQNKTHEGIDQQQREYFLQQQIKTIQNELGDSQSKFVEDLKKKAEGKKWTKEVAEIFHAELSKLDRMTQHSADYSVQLSYLETIVNLPWGEYTKDSINLKKVKKILDRDHFGMEKIKDRFIEHLAVLKLKKDLKAPIICLVGPPGVGKTSLGKSVAEALGRKYVRMSLGGLHDEAELRGHRRTYIGAMPGRIIQGLQKAGSSNPVFILDEIDKVSHDYKGDPESALLEILDPEQNSTFHDNFLDIDYDLSHVMFIATANDLSTVSKPLLDRMEIIEVGGYIQEEKVHIAKDYLLPKEIENHGLHSEDLVLSSQMIEKIIDGYTRESGVRQLDKQLCKLMRKVACKIAMKNEYEPQITEESLTEMLGPVRFSRDKYQGNDYAGVVTGLAWTSVGGEILFVEASMSKSKAPKLTLTGNLGDVMKESAVIALEYIRAHSDYWNIDQKTFEENDIFIHVPEGAVPKDGPSAGVTMITAIVSALTKRKVRRSLAMTGEITLRGKVLPVGGIREKILAAKRAGIKEIILCKENEKDILEIPSAYLKGLSFHYVEDIRQVTDFAILKEKSEK